MSRLRVSLRVSVVTSTVTWGLVCALLVAGALLGHLDSGWRGSEEAVAPMVPCLGSLLGTNKILKCRDVCEEIYDEASPQRSLAEYRCRFRYQVGDC